ARQMEPEYTPLRKIHLYHCDHRGLPLALMRRDGSPGWRAEYDEWGTVLREDNPEGLEQLIRLPGQQADTETGLYYNRHRYYDPTAGRYITQDPIGLQGGWNPYTYPLDPVKHVDPFGLQPSNGFGTGFINYIQAAGSLGISMAESGTSPEETSAAFSHMAQGDLPKQAKQFMEGWVYGSASFASVAAIACLSTPLAISGALTGGANTLNQVWNGGDFSFSDTYIATNVGILTEGRGLIATTGINVAGYSISNMIKGTAQTAKGVASTILGSIFGYGTGKGIGSLVSGTAATAGGTVATEVTTSAANHMLDGLEE
ncbi:core protein, partial [Yokenella regensburgei ATCC 49455]